MEKFVSDTEAAEVASTIANDVTNATSLSSDMHIDALVRLACAKAERNPPPGVSAEAMEQYLAPLKQFLSAHE